MGVLSLLEADQYKQKPHVISDNSAAAFVKKLHGILLGNRS